MGQLNGDPLDRLFSSIGLPSSSTASLPTFNASNNVISPSKASTYSITSSPTSSSNPLDHILSPLIPSSTIKHAGSTSVSNKISLPSTSTSSLCISTSAPFSNTTLDQPRSDAAWANIWASLTFAPSPTIAERVNDNDLFRPEASTWSHIRFLDKYDINPQTFHHPASSSTQISTASTQPPVSCPLTKVKMFLTTTVHPGLRAYPNTLFPSAFQSIGITTKTVTQMAQTVTQTVTATVTLTATVTAAPTATDFIVADAFSCVNAAANLSIFKTTTINLINRMLDHATADDFFLKTAATKIINGAPPVLPLSSGTKLTCLLASFLLGAGVLQTAQYLRQPRRPAPPAPINAEERIARRWGFLWRREVKTSVALQKIVDDQAAQLLEFDIQDALNAQYAYDVSDVSDTTDEIIPPQDIQAFMPITKRYARDITARGIPLQETDTFTPITRRYAQDVLPSAIRAPPSSFPQTISPLTSHRMLFPAEEKDEKLPANISTPIHRDFTAPDAFMQKQTYSSGAQSNMTIIEDILKKSFTKAKAWEESKSATTGLRRKRSSDDAKNDSYENIRADVNPDTFVPTAETPESSDMDDTMASSSQENPVLDLENKPAQRFFKRLRASSEVSDAAPVAPVAWTTPYKSPRKARDNMTVLEPGTVRRSSRIRPMSPKK